MAQAHFIGVRKRIIGLVSALSLSLLFIAPLGIASASGVANSRGYHTLRYVALGDSVAAGLGLSPVENPTAEDTACGRSSDAYSTTVANGINAQLSEVGLHIDSSNVACQGAVVANLTQQQTIGSVDVLPQLDKAFATGTPALLTVTIGANDVHWSNFIGACFSAANCDTPENTTLAHGYIATMQSQLTQTLADIRSRSAGQVAPIIIVTGYYDPVSAQCANPNFTQDEINWLASITTDFNMALRAATQNAGGLTKFAPIDFTGHDICSPEPWLQRPGVVGEPAAFHPNAQGQKVMGEAVLRTLGL